MVHPALLNADIVSIICESLNQRSLSALARTARFLQEPALRELWRDIGLLSQLFCPFGSSMERTRRKIRFRNPPTSTQWDRFRFYAQFVRYLSITYDDWNGQPVLPKLFQHLPLLPHLKSLTIYWDRQAGYPSTCTMFFVASLQTFKIYNCEDLSVLDYLVKELATTAPALRDLQIAAQSPTGSREFGSFIPKFHNLHSLDIPLTDLHMHSVLSHLTTLPSLSRIRFLTIFSSEVSSSGLKYLFPATRKLEIDSNDDYAIMPLMGLTRFDNLASLAIRCDSRQMAVGSDFFKAFPVSFGQHLDHIEITSVGEAPEPMEFSAIFALLKFANIHFFEMSTKQILWPTDEDIQVVAKSWTKLEEFSINRFGDGVALDSSLTFTGLLSLIEQCTSLMTISIAVNAWDVPNVTSPIRRSGLVIRIQHDFSPINDSKPLANFLSLALPDASIDTVDDPNPLAPDPLDGDYCSLWEEGLLLREYFMEGRKEGEKDAIKQIQEQQIALNACYTEIAHLRSLQSSIHS